MKNKAEDLLYLIDLDKKRIEENTKLSAILIDHLKSILDVFKTLVVDREISYNIIVDAHSMIGSYLDSIEFYEPKFDITLITSIIIKYSDFVKYECDNVYYNIERFIDHREDDACGLF